MKIRIGIFIIFCWGMYSYSIGSEVTFNQSGIMLVDGKPYFPLGVYTYNVDNSVIQEIKKEGFNTVVAGFKPEDVELIQKNGLKAICNVGEEWKPVRENPALLSWYLTDEPEGHGLSPDAVKENYLKWKEFDSHHPIGLCHFLFEALGKYKEGCDYTMTDVYPVTANRDTPLRNVGIHIDEARRVHGVNWPNFTFIQIFGGPETEGGKWAQPTPIEIRCMTFIAFVHRASGILYFPYYAKKREIWDSVGQLNEDIKKIIPYLTGDGKELQSQSSQEQIQVRVRSIGNKGIVMAVNTEPNFVKVEITLPDIKRKQLTLPFENRKIEIKSNKLVETFLPNETHIYTW